MQQLLCPAYEGEVASAGEAVLAAAGT